MPSAAPRPHRTAPLVALAAVLALLAGCTDSGLTTATRQSPERGTQDQGASPTAGGLRWGACSDQMAAAARLDCARLEVPLDHDEADGQQIELALARQAATGPPEERIGSLVFNPGGPGGSGIEFLANAAAAVPEELARRFDLVSFDPRGVGESTPVRCVDDRTKDEHLEGDLSPDTEAELQLSLDRSEEFLEGCLEHSGDMIEHMSTADVAADVDLIREAVGDEQLSYVGFSYGTSIGAVYASLFPERVRALVLDGSVSPDAGPEEEVLAQGRGFEGTFASFVEHCDADPACALGPDAAAAVAATRASLEQQPVQVDDPAGTRTMGPDLFDYAVGTALYDTALWGTAASAVAAIREGGAELLFALVDRQIGREPDGSYDNSSDAQTMVNCADQEERPTLEEGRAAAQRIIDQLPTFGETFGWGVLSCLDWPEADNPLPEIRGEGAPPILVVGTLGDPATPYAWSVEMAEALESASLLTYEGDGHTAFLRGGPCVDDAVVAYLVDTTVPDEGASCPAQEESVSFDGLREEVVSQFEDAGLPRSAAECVVDGIIGDVGRAEFELMILTNDLQRLPALVQRHATSCALGG